MRLRPVWFALWACVIAYTLPSGALAQDSSTQTGSFFGYAYGLDDSDFRYLEHHRQRRRGDNILDWQVSFVDASGSVIATKTLLPGDHPALPEYTLQMKSGYAESLRWGGSTLIASRTRDGATREATFQPDAMACADSGFDHYVRQRWDDITSGDKIRFTFVLPGKLNDYSFKAKQVGSETFEGRPARVFKVYLGGILGWFAPPLELLYDAETRQLKEYRGIGNMHGDNGRPYPVRVSYYSAPPDGLPAPIQRHIRTTDPQADVER